MYNFVQLKFGLWVIFSQFKKRKRYTGTAKEICQQIIDDCWNGHFFQTSTTNFPQFWTRDFGWCCKSLISLGYQKKVQQTLRYALRRFKEAGRVTTTISPQGRPFDVPYFSVDSLPYLVHSLKISGFPYREYKKFLDWQIKLFFEEVIDPLTGLVKPDKRFSSMKDLSIRKGSCYDNCMVAMLAADLGAMELKNPFTQYDYAALIKEHFWNGKFFYDDLRKQEYLAGDAQVYPFALGVIKDKEMLESALRRVEEVGLDVPFPLRYTNKEAKVRFIWEERLVRGYEFDAVWTHMGPFYIGLVKKVNLELAKKYKILYGQMIEKHGNYLEVFSAKGKPFRMLLYKCDQGMLWAANYLTL